MGIQIIREHEMTEGVLRSMQDAKEAMIAFGSSNTSPKLRGPGYTRPRAGTRGKHGKRRGGGK